MGLGQGLHNYVGGVEGITRGLGLSLDRISPMFTGKKCPVYGKWKEYHFVIQSKERKLFYYEQGSVRSCVCMCCVYNMCGRVHMYMYMCIYVQCVLCTCIAVYVRVCTHAS